MDKPMNIQEVIEYYNSMVKEPGEPEEIEQLIRDNQRVTEKERELGLRVITRYQSAIRELKRLEEYGDLWISGKRYPRGSDQYAAEISRLETVITFIEGLDQSY